MPIFEAHGVLVYCLVNLCVNGTSSSRDRVVRLIHWFLPRQVPDNFTALYNAFGAWASFLLHNSIPASFPFWNWLMSVGLRYSRFYCSRVNLFLFFSFFPVQFPQLSCITSSSFSSSFHLRLNFTGLRRLFFSFLFVKFDFLFLLCGFMSFRQVMIFFEGLLSFFPDFQSSPIRCYCAWFAWYVLS